MIVIDRHRAWGLLSAVAIVVGSLGPWFTLDSESLTGASGEGDGWVTLALGVWAFAWIAFRRTPTPRLLTAIIAGGVAAAVVVRFLRIEVDHDGAVGWGLILIIVGSVSLVAWSLATLAATPEAKWSQQLSRAAVVIVLLVLFLPFGAPGPDGDQSKSLARQWADKRTESSDDGSSAASTTSSPAEDEDEDDKGKDECSARGMWPGEGAEGSCTGPDGETIFHFANGDSPLKLYEITVRDVAVRMTSVLSGPDRSPVRASGTWAEITVTVRNKGQGPIHIYPTMFELNVSEANFRPNDNAMTVSGDSCLRKVRPLPPGKERTCWLAFDVPSESADDVPWVGSLSVVQPSDMGADKISQPIGYVRLRDADGGTNDQS